MLEKPLPTKRIFAIPKFQKIGVSVMNRERMLSQLNLLEKALIDTAKCIRAIRAELSSPYLARGFRLGNENEIDIETIKSRVLYEVKLAGKEGIQPSILCRAPDIRQASFAVQEEAIYSLLDDKKIHLITGKISKTGGRPTKRLSISP